MDEKETIRYENQLENPIIGKKHLRREKEILVLKAPYPLKSISAGVTGAGIGTYQYFINRSVDKDYNPSDYKQEMIQFLHKNGFDPEQAVGMMTAVQLEDAVAQTFYGNNFSIFIVVTAGTGNAVDATLGKKHIEHWLPGTINTWVFVNGKISDAAFIQGIITATEAKTKVLREAEILDSLTNTLATGTSTDSILIAATQTGRKLEFAGPISELGALIGEGVYHCTKEALEKSRRRKC